MSRPRLLGALSASLLTVVSMAVHPAIYNVTGTFIMRNPTGDISGSTDNTVFGTFDDTGSTTLNLGTHQPHYGALWAATGSTYGEGNWNFEACLPDGSTHCIAPAPISMTVGAGKWGGHFLVDWSVNENFDVLNVWDVTLDPSGTIHLAATDPDGDGILGIKAVDGPFVGFSWSFDLVLTPVPIPPAIWLFGSGLLGLVGIARRKKTA